MNKQENITAVERMAEEIRKIDSKESNLFFYVLDTKGVPCGWLNYIYGLALIAKNDGYNVTMLYQKQNQEDEFVGVGEWLGSDFSSLRHEDVSDGNVGVSPSDVLFIPELFANVMTSTKSLPCKRVVIMQNFDNVVDQTPFAAQWGDFGIFDVVCNTPQSEEKIKDVFPYLNTTVIEPYIGTVFGETSEPKKLVVNVIARDKSDVNKIVKSFYWKNPSLRWVSFRDLRGFSQEEYASMLREGIVTVWVDDYASFGYGALEAIKSGSVVVAKVPSEPQPWVVSDDGETLSDACIWFEDYMGLPSMLASIITAWMSDKMPSDVMEKGKEIANKYTLENTSKNFLGYLNNILTKRKSEINELMVNVKNNKEEEKQE